MRHHIATGAAFLLLTATAAVAPTSKVAADPGGASKDHDSGGSYVVAYDLADKNAALNAIRKAGGRVQSAQSQIGLALVSAPAGFKAKVSKDHAIDGAMLDASIGATRKNMPRVRATERLTVKTAGKAGTAPRPSARARASTTDTLEPLQWDMRMIGATRNQAHRVATGRGVTVGIIDTGVDASHPDIAPNFNRRLSRNFVHDMPDIDGPCDTPSCVDPADVDEGGHGTHVAGTVAAARNSTGVVGVAPRASLVNVRAGQDSGYFFLYETVAAILYSGAVGLDVVNMSFYTDPWLYNCKSGSDYISGDYTQAEIDEQRLTRRAIIAAVRYAHSRGVTLVAAAGNGLTNLALPTREDDSSPDYPEGAAKPRVVTDDCLDLPTEAPHVISVSSVGPSGTKADYSNYGLGDVDVAAPGGWFRDGYGTASFRTNQNLILSSYPYDLAIEEGYLNKDGTPAAGTDAYGSCDSAGNCGAWVWLQGTSMASPHVAGEAALITQAHGRRDARRGGFSLNPNRVQRIIERTATDHACPVGGFEDYSQEGRPAEYNAVCEGNTDENGLYGEGIINAAAAVASRRP